MLPVIAGIAMAVGTAAGAYYASRQSERVASDNREFQDEMSRTAHQREVADLRAAGLNPVLSAGGKGASTPSGATSTYENPFPASSAKMLSYEVSESKARQAELKSKQEMNQALALKAKSDRRVSDATKQNIDVQKHLASLGIPAAVNSARMHETWFGKKVLPYINPLKDLGLGIGAARYGLTGGRNIGAASAKSAGSYNRALKRLKYPPDSKALYNKLRESRPRYFDGLDMKRY